MNQPRHLLCLLLLLVSAPPGSAEQPRGVRVRVDRTESAMGQPVAITFVVTSRNGEQVAWDATDDFFRKSKAVFFLRSETKNRSACVVEHTVTFTALRKMSWDAGSVPVVVRGVNGTDTLRARNRKMTFAAERIGSSLHALRPTVALWEPADHVLGLWTGGALLLLSAGAATYRHFSKGRTAVPDRDTSRKAALSKILQLEQTLGEAAALGTEPADHLFGALIEYLDHCPVGDVYPEHSGPVRYAAFAAQLDGADALQWAATLTRLAELRFARGPGDMRDQAKLLHDVKGLVVRLEATYPPSGRRS